MRDADEADRGAGAGDREGLLHGGVVADALEHGVGADAAGDLPDELGALLAALGDDVGGAELAGDLLARARAATSR